MMLNLSVLMMQETKSNWQAVKKGLNLVPEENNDMRYFNFLLEQANTYEF